MSPQHRDFGVGPKVFRKFAGFGGSLKSNLISKPAERFSPVGITGSYGDPLQTCQAPNSLFRVFAAALRNLESAAMLLYRPFELVDFMSKCGPLFVI